LNNATFIGDLEGADPVDLRVLFNSRGLRPNITFVNPTPANGAVTAEKYIPINTTVTNASELNNFVWDLNGTNYTLYDESLVLLLNFNNVTSIGENGTNAADVSPYGNNALVNAEMNVTGSCAGGTYIFNGSGSYIEMSDSQSLNMTGSNIVLAARVSPEGDTKRYVLGRAPNSTENETRYGLYITPTNQLGFELKTTNGTVKLEGGSVPNGECTHIAGVYNGTQMMIYVNGVLKATANQNGTLDAHDTKVYVGAIVNDSYFNGSIGQVQIYNRGMDAAEVQQLASTILEKTGPDTWSFSGNPPVTRGSVTFRASIIDSMGTYAETDERDNDVLNHPPETPLPSVSSPSSTTDNDLTCSATISDFDGDIMNVTVVWYNSNSPVVTHNLNNNYASGGVVQDTLDKSNLGSGDVWKCGYTLFDGMNYSAEGFSSELTIVNRAPTISLISPDDGSSTTNRTPSFSWSGSDPDSDMLTYEFNISLVAASVCTEGDRYQTSLGTSYTLTSDLACIFDNGDYYMWSARSYDGVNYSEWAAYRSIKINSLVSMNLTNSIVNFGNLGYLKTNDTTSGVPQPFVIENDGNVLLNITIKAANLWNTIANPNQYYKFKAREAEGGSFDLGNSVTSFTNMSSSTTPVMCVSALKYSDATDSANVDIYVKVPPDEPIGARSSTVSFTYTLAE
jgi:hypothetical protein